MEACLTPVLPGTLPGPEDSDRIKRAKKDPCKKLPHSVEPDQRVTETSTEQQQDTVCESSAASKEDAIQECVPFRDALELLLKAHEGEIAALQEEVSRLRGVPVQCAAHQHQEMKAVCTNSNVGRYQVEVQLEEDGMRSEHAKCEGSPHLQISLSQPSSCSELEQSKRHSGILHVEHSITEPATSPRASQVQLALPQAPNGSELAETKRHSGILMRRSMTEPAKDSEDSQVQFRLSSSSGCEINEEKRNSMLVDMERRVSRKSEVGKRRSGAVLKHGLTFDQSTYEAIADCDLWEQRWAKLVYDMYMYATLQHDTNELHDTWAMTNGYLVKLAKNKDEVDIWKNVSRRRNLNRQRVTDKTSFHDHGNHHLLDAFDVHKAVHAADRAVHAILDRQHFLQDAQTGLEYLHAAGLVAFIEAYVVVLPSSAKRLAWICIGMFLMLYDVVVVPLQAFDIDENKGALYAARWFQAIFWSCDMLLTFFTGIYIDQEMVCKLRAIAHRYAKTWLLFDLAMLIPVWFEDYSASGALRITRMMRFFRLIRLVKFSVLLDEQLKAVNSPSLNLTFRLLQLLLGLIMFAHVNACLWFAVGNQQGGWTVQVSDSDQLYKYLTAVHWALTQFQGTSEIYPGKLTGERIYAVLTVLITLIMAAAFLSNATNIIMRLQSLTVERDRQVQEICKYMESHQIPRDLSMRIRNYLRWKADSDEVNDCEALSSLPEGLVMELEFEIHSPTTDHHPFFQEFARVYPRFCRRVFHNVLCPVFMSPGDLIFSAQESSTCLHFIVTGILDYTVILRRADEALELGREQVSTGITLSEPTLWMHWQHKGTLVAHTHCRLLSLTSEAWRKVIPTHPPAHLACKLYARRLMAGLEKHCWRCTDIIEPFQIVSDAEDDLMYALGGNIVQHRLTVSSELTTDSSQHFDSEAVGQQFASDGRHASYRVST